MKAALCTREMKKGSDCLWVLPLSLHANVCSTWGAQKGPEILAALCLQPQALPFLRTSILPRPSCLDRSPDGEPPPLWGQGEGSEDDHAFSRSVLVGTEEKAPSWRHVLQVPGLQEGMRMFVASINRKLIFVQNLCPTLLSRPELEVKSASRDDWCLTLRCSLSSLCRQCEKTAG